MAARIGLRGAARRHLAEAGGKHVPWGVAGEGTYTASTKGCFDVIARCGPLVREATERALARAGMTLGEIDLYEVNEAFAPVPLAWAKALGADPARLNVHGGAISLGHPLGGSGAKLMATLVSALHDRGARYGLQTMCEAGGMANVTIVERL